ncbi:hypothetical protein WKR88_14830 [Trinickia caryophylli]|uniref:Uncharacterized protein n=1 Tax=Trinickia caryophylli TaxID=28094 RepID=A0A1X7FMU9_TRICW|nr:hypothetical protein [Trinickia caryophylli]PMS13851.1 hypothetical protein C0Z17_03015 [Trinickia caryophylli]TRX14344.1 hypothetical protein FNF07_23970 [Trinickia caryophylli]WQE14178.1 hypothetical protein U0034_26165 [Trinickia caryophylli]SMF55213.1 hypothetical protein SAMN06295900_11033 [Trinickia caryophylli]GLU33320.1 hypothetical protein Busp01_31620 [Trinickia caryophylli]
MKTWLGLLAAPALVLAVQSVDYALVRYTCERGDPVPLNVVSALAFAFSIAATTLAYRNWRHAAAPFPASYEPRAARPAFLAFAATVLGAFSALVQLTMWFPQWLLSPCR